MFNRAFGRLMFNESKAYKPGMPAPVVMKSRMTVKPSSGRAASLSTNVKSGMKVLGSRIFFFHVKLVSQANVSAEVLAAVFGETISSSSLNVSVLGTRSTAGEVNPSVMVVSLAVHPSMFKWEREPLPGLDWTDKEMGTSHWSPVPLGDATWGKVR